MEYLYASYYLNGGDVVEVTLDRQANVLLIDALNYPRYRAGQTFNYHGGLAVLSPVRLVVPNVGIWYVVIDLGGAGGYINYSTRIIKARVGVI